MQFLPSGRVVDLSIDRARYHALRRQIGQHDSESQLWQVVDVVYRMRGPNGDIRRGWTEYDFHYSGYTVTDIATAPDWSEQDKQQFLHWLQQHKQPLLKSVRRRLEGCHAGLSIKTNSAPEYLHSRLQRWLTNHSTQRATAAQWQATLLNLKNTGIKEEELQWSGLLTFLSTQAAGQCVEKSQLLSLLEANLLRIELTLEREWAADGSLAFREVATQLPHQAIYRTKLKLDASCHCVLRYLDDGFNYRIGVIKTLAYGHFMAMNRFWFALDPYGRPISNDADGNRFFSTSGKAMEAANKHARMHYNIRGGVAFKTRYGHLTLHGGHDYREWLITLPDHQRSFFGPHYFDHNVLAHVRTTTRSDQQGRKLLFIEELQSDWHQQGATFGYDNSPWGKIANAPFKKSWVSLVCKLMLIRASQNGFDGIAWSSGAIQRLRYDKDINAIARRYDQEIPAVFDRLGKAFDISTTQCEIITRDPWLNLVQSKDKWQVAGGQGKFVTRARYSREQAMEIAARHSKVVQLAMPAFYLNDTLRWQIANQGLPLFGESLGI